MYKDSPWCIPTFIFSTSAPHFLSLALSVCSSRLPLPSHPASPSLFSITPFLRLAPSHLLSASLPFVCSRSPSVLSVRSLSVPYLAYQVIALGVCRMGGGQAILPKLSLGRCEQVILSTLGLGARQGHAGGSGPVWCKTGNTKGEGGPQSIRPRSGREERKGTLLAQYWRGTAKRLIIIKLFSSVESVCLRLSDWDECVFVVEVVCLYLLNCKSLSLTLSVF